ncbi:Predicted amidohydrolase [Arboricoccus pini]|uniref:Predicted amidohydrolase n=1 Tax=Arboricoccus pini TaxID=1963835 RepID=A0A212RHL4_9PROT|nr:nitrilase-related carbon-nitrogen hydrolase [Arboricoccus pini]SNB71913.1 Predicted amidohydrolase [Arboricoccus pini]
MTSYKAAAIQFEPTMFEKGRNIEVLLREVDTAARAGARLIVTPEMGTTGYCWLNRAEVAPFVETVPGPTTERFAALARVHDCLIVIGMPEVDPASDLYYNSAVLIGPDGVIGTHRKSHPYISEPKWAASGATHQVFETKFGKIALLVCMDIHFIETARLVALKGADVICHVSNWLAERTPAPYWITRAVENGCYLIESNRYGLERTVQFSGGSCIIEPDGTLAAVVDDGPGIAYATIDLARTQARRHVLGHPVFEQRRPELYMELATTTFAWNPLDFFGLYGLEPLPPGRRTKIAAAQFTPGTDLARNLERIETLATQAREGGAELVVFPHLALTGRPGGRESALPRDAAAIQKLMALATRLRLDLVVSLAEAAGAKIYITTLIIGAAGIRASYRQTHLTEAERAWATPGQDWTVIDLPLGRVGILSGHDASFPEAGRVLALRGCDLIVLPAAIESGFVAGHPGSQVRQNYPIPTGADLHHWHLFRARAGENNCFLAFANIGASPSGQAGKSGVFGPDTFEFPRREAIVPDGEGLAIAEIDTTNVAPPYPTNIIRRKDLVTMRLPHHYAPLVGRPWNSQ